MTSPSAPAARFDMDAFLALPRCEGLVRSPDGRRLVTTVSSPAADGKRLHSALWLLDPQGARAPRRLTWGVTGESDPRFGPDGTLYFLAARPLPDRRPGDEREVAALWRLPDGGGEAEVVAAPDSGVDAYAVARDAGTVVIAASLHPSATTWQEDEERERARRDAGVTARLFTGYPFRHWDHDLGPRQRHLAVAGDSEPRILTRAAGRALDVVDFDVTPDGGTVVAGWREGSADPARARVRLVAIDVASGERRTLRDDAANYAAVRAAPDGRSVACLRTEHGTPERAERRSLAVVDLSTGELRTLAADLGEWPHTVTWADDSGTLYVTADADGQTLPSRVDAATGASSRLAGEGAFSALCPGPDGRTVFALRSSLAAPPALVALGDEGRVRPLPSPGAEPDPAPPGTVERSSGRAADGTRIGAWLVLPPGASPQQPAPLVVMAHGGPYSSWTGWHWRWNPHLLADRGYAVLLPDPAPSTGYGQGFVDRGWGRWGEVTAADLDAAVDAACHRPDVDGERLAVAGGSFGGYVANWVAGTRRRYRAIVTHASIWGNDRFGRTTDDAAEWEREFGPAGGRPWSDASPDRHVDGVTAPVLVIHGERDLRVPHGESVALYTDLVRRGVDARFLSFPDEHHWVLTPSNTRIWYGTVLAFLDEHLLGRPSDPPDLL